MSEEMHSCPQCQSAHAYQDGNLWICPECFHEWTPSSDTTKPEDENAANESSPFLDSNGVQLQTGDTVATIKDLKMGSETLKSGTKAKNIRLLDEPVNGHDIACKIPGHGSIFLKCSVVKKLK